MKMSDAFPSKWVASSDLAGKDVTLNIAGVTMEEVGRDRERLPVVWFHGAQKGLVLNKTNGNTISGMYGDDTDNWTGRPITLYATEVEYAGQITLGIRIRLQQQAHQSPPQQGAGPTPSQQGYQVSDSGYVPGPNDPNNVGGADTFDQGRQGPDDLDDSIPF